VWKEHANGGNAINETIARQPSVWLRDVTISLKYQRFYIGL